MTSTTSSEPSRPDSAIELHREMRLAVGQPAAHRRADAGRDVRVDHVHVERDVDERRAPAMWVERLADRPLDPDPVDVAHRVDARCSSRAAARARPCPATGRRRARHGPGRARGSVHDSLSNSVVHEPERARRAPCRGRFRSATWPACSGRRARRSRARRRRRGPRRGRRASRARPSGRRRARAGRSPSRRRGRDERRDAGAGRLDLRQVARPLVAGRRPPP